LESPRRKHIQICGSGTAVSSPLHRAERAGQDAVLPEATFSLTTVSMSKTSAAERESVRETPRIVGFWIPTAGRSSEDRWRIDDLVRHLWPSAAASNGPHGLMREYRSGRIIVQDFRARAWLEAGNVSVIDNV
jgi:hypothetical protein